MMHGLNALRRSFRQSMSVRIVGDRPRFCERRVAPVEERGMGQHRHPCTARRLANRDLVRLEARNHRQIHRVRRGEGAVEIGPAAAEAVVASPTRYLRRDRCWLSSCSVNGGVAKRAPRCIAQPWRNGWKPPCISFEIERAWARALPSRRPDGPVRKLFRQIFDDGETFPDGHVAVDQSRQLCQKESIRATGFCCRAARSGMTISSNGISKALSTIHGRSDHDE